MVDSFILIPDYQVFESANLAREVNQIDNSCLNLFKKSWLHYIDSRERFIFISKELDQILLEKHYKAKKQKREALFAILRIYDKDLGCSQDEAQIKLVRILSIEEDKKVYYVTDNPIIRDAMNKTSIISISSPEALKLVEDSLKEIQSKIVVEDFSNL